MRRARPSPCVGAHTRRWGYTRDVSVSVCALGRHAFPTGQTLLLSSENVNYLQGWSRQCLRGEERTAPCVKGLSATRGSAPSHPNSLFLLLFLRGHGIFPMYETRCSRVVRQHTAPAGLLPCLPRSGLRGAGVPAGAAGGSRRRGTGGCV